MSPEVGKKLSMLLLHTYTKQLFDILIGILWVAIAAFLVFGFWGKTYDDVFLAFQYARNLESGLGFVFNPGENFLGTPAPLFVLLLAGVHKLIPWITLPQIGSLLSGVGLSLAGWIAVQTGRYWNQRWLGFLCGLLLVLSPFTIMTLGGETPIFLAMAMAAIYYYCVDKPIISACLLGLAMVNRSEAVILIVILLGLFVYEKRRIPFAMMFALSVILIPWFVYSFLVYGGPISNSFTAKIAQVAAGLERYPFGFRHWTGNIVRQTHYLLLAVIPASGLGLLTLPFIGKPWRIVVAWTVSQTVAYVLLPIPFYHWYAAQIGVLLAVLVSLGTVQIIQMVQNPQKVSHRLLARLFPRTWNVPELLGRSWRGILIILCVTLMGVVIYAQVQFARKYQTSVPNPSNWLYFKTGTWLANNTPKDAKVAYLEIGQIAFYSNRYIVDTLGLVSPGISQRVAQNNWVWAFQKYKPDYILYNDVFANWMNNLFAEEWFTKGFEEVAVIEEPGYTSPLRIFHKKKGIQIPDPVEIDLNYSGGQETVGRVFDKQTVRQTFFAQHDGFSAFEIRVATYAHQVNGQLDIELLDANRRKMGSWQTNGTDIMDNQWRRYYFAPIGRSQGQEFTLEIRYSNNRGGARRFVMR